MAHGVMHYAADARYRMDPGLDGHGGKTELRSLPLPFNSFSMISLQSDSSRGPAASGATPCEMLSKAGCRRLQDRRQLLMTNCNEIGHSSS